MAIFANYNLNKSYIYDHNYIPAISGANTHRRYGEKIIYKQPFSAKQLHNRWTKRKN
jgi:hypothetical protein